MYSSSYTDPDAKVEVYEAPYALPGFGADGATREDFILIALLAGNSYDPVSPSFDGSDTYTDACA